MPDLSAPTTHASCMREVGRVHRETQVNGSEESLNSAGLGVPAIFGGATLNGLAATPILGYPFSHRI
ncbi:hypothetical protein DVH24_012369 [Malus domestica]|uniref:Uncharacterized protein n=1 Tax=Malus domestica TaxID=3750 RepID=A0A498HSZ4_MALDO|nr:hypothetical protein DVH24_012369 [Malus domestica]